MKTLVLFLTVLVLFSSSSRCLSAQADNKEKPKPIEQLLSQKRDLLKQRLDIVSIRFADASTTLSALLDAQQDLLEVELALAKTKAERIRLKLSHLKAMRNLEKQHKKLFEFGNTTKDNVLIVRAAMIDAEIALLKENGDKTEPQVSSIDAAPRSGRGNPIDRRAILAAEKIEQYDQDGDGQLDIEEAPLGYRMDFKSIDADQNGKLDKAELVNRFRHSSGIVR